MKVKPKAGIFTSDPLFHKTDPRIRIYNNMKRIRNTAFFFTFFGRLNGFITVHPRRQQCVDVRVVRDRDSTLDRKHCSWIQLFFNRLHLGDKKTDSNHPNNANFISILCVKKKKKNISRMRVNFILTIFLDIVRKPKDNRHFEDILETKDFLWTRDIFWTRKIL